MPTAMENPLMTASSEFAGQMRRGSEAFWNRQKELLGIMESFATGWFARRHVGVAAALEAADRMCRAPTPQEFLSEYQKWAAGALERVTADCTACQCELGKLARGLSSPAVADNQNVGSVETRRRAA